MNTRNPRNRYLIRRALAYAIPLMHHVEGGDEDILDMHQLLIDLNGDSWHRNDESICWQMFAGKLLRDEPARTSQAHSRAPAPPKLRLVCKPTDEPPPPPAA
jgi:hypothetical protein